MSGYFWVASIVMTFLAFSFLVRPMLSAGRHETAVLLAFALPIFVAGLYLLLGSPDISSARSNKPTQDVSAAGSDSTEAATKLGSVASMTAGLEARLAENPDDAKGWLLLSKSYKHLNRMEDATDAYARAEVLGEQDPELSASLLDDTDADMSGAQIPGRLSLSDRAAGLVLPTDTVFIFARAAAGSGVPAAVIQRPAAELPIDFLLNDSQAMVADVKLSDFEKVVVTARISRSGNATEALQNLEARTNPVVVADNGHINLTIE